MAQRLLTRKFAPSFTLLIFMGTLVGSLLGLSFGRQLSFLNIGGELFLNLLQMTIVPLVFCSVVNALGHLDAANLKKVGAKILFWFSTTTFFAGIIGIGLGFLIHAKLPADSSLPAVQTTSPVNWQKTLLNLVPQNIFNAFAQGNVGQIIIFAIFLGALLSYSNRQHHYDQLLTLVTQLNDLIIQLITLIMRIAPLGIACLMVKTTATHGITLLLPLLYFLFLYGSGVVVFLVFLTLLTILRTQIPLAKLFKGLTRILLVAFTTTSSAVTLPVELMDVQHRLGVSKSVSELVLPLGMVLNSNGLAMYLALVCTAIAQIYHLPLTTPKLAEFILLAVLLCVGTITVPCGGIMALTIAVTTLHLPAESIALFASIDWFVGMFRTVANVIGDVTTAVIIDYEEAG